jgi:hypothetical protein
MQPFLTFNLSFCNLATVLATFPKIGLFFQTSGRSDYRCKKIITETIIVFLSYTGLGIIIGLSVWGKINTIGANVIKLFTAVSYASRKKLEHLSLASLSMESSRKFVGKARSLS